MKKHILYIIGILFPLLAMAQAGGYDPVNPPSPGWGEQAANTHQVVLEAIPDFAGSLRGATRYTQGTQVTITATARGDNQFVAWLDAEGNVVTTETSYTFEMPAKDVKYYARFTYSPTNPDSPQFPAQSYPLYVSCTPVVACTFSWESGKRATEGSTVRITPSANSGFRFLRWEEKVGDATIVLSTDRVLNYLMPSHSANLKAVYEYDPAEPPSPSPNAWDANSGEMFVNYFPDGIYNTMNALCNREYAKVTHLTLCGELDNTFNSVGSYYEEITYMNLQKVTGNTPLQYVKGTWTNLKQLVLPETLTTLGKLTFKGCTQLQSVTLPGKQMLSCPTFDKDNETTYPFPAGIMLYVDESMLAAYTADPNFSAVYNVAAIPSTDCQIEIILPDVCSDKRYKNMTLELVNTMTKARQRYVISDRLRYIFPSVERGSKYNVYIKNASHHILAQNTSPITIANDVEQYQFDLQTEMTLPQDVSLMVLAGVNNVTSQVNITWKDGLGTLLGTGSTVTSQAVGYDVHYQIEFSDYLLGSYKLPTGAYSYIVKDGDNSIIHKLEQLPAFTLNLNVQSNDTNQPMDCQVNISSKVNGSHTATWNYSVKGGNQSAKVVYDGNPVSVTVSADGYISANLQLTTEELDQAVKDGSLTKNVSLQTINGIVGKLHFAYYTDAKGQPSKFSDEQNATYSLMNLTKGTPITKFDVQYPNLYILEGAEQGDKIQATVTSIAGTFNDAMTTGTVAADNTVPLDFDVYAYGGIRARFLVTDNLAVEGILFDSNGNLIDHAAYGTNFEIVDTELGDVNQHNAQENWVEFTNLKSGKYTLITMGKSDFFGIHATLDKYAQYGLKAGVDYVQTEVTVSDAEQTYIRNVLVPLFDESKLYYTGKNTSFSVNKPNVIAGNYLTLTAKVDFKQEVKDNVSDVELVIDLPKNVSVVAGSMMLGKKVVAFEQRDGQVILPLGENYTDRVKFCIVTTQRGNYTPDASVRFNLLADGKKEVKTQPIGNAPYTVTDLTMWAPYMISTSDVHVDGNAPSLADITVYDGNTIIGQTKALADGYWYLDAQLPIWDVAITPSRQQTVTTPQNLAFHELWAEVTTQAGVTMKTERMMVEYNAASIQAKTVKMSLYNDMINVDRGVWVNFDLERLKASQKSYAFEPGVDIVFTADLTDNNPERINGVTLRVFTINHDWLELPMQYVPTLNRWVATDKFDTSNAPIGVRVSVDSKLSDVVVAPQPSDIPTSVISWSCEGRDYTINPDAQYVGNLPTVFPIPTQGYELLTDGLFKDVQNWYKEYPDMAEHLIGRAEDGTYYIAYKDGRTVSIASAATGNKSLKAKVATVQVTELQQMIQRLDDLFTHANELITERRQYAETLLDNAHLQDVNSLYGVLRSLNYVISWTHSGIKDVNAWQAFNDRILPCNGLDDAQARALWMICEELRDRHGERYILACDLAERAFHLLDYMLESPEQRLPNLTAANRALLDMIVSSASDVYKVNRIQSRNHLRKAKRDRNLYKCGYASMEELDDNWFTNTPYPIVEPIIDPQGYVYEGVSSNRLPGVTATAYYKRTYEDIYGDTQEEVVLWDATQYNQQNPLLTDEQGFYQWDVPSGLWQVKFEKEGYQTTYTDWLPVPPPQMDVNVGMVQASLPEVTKARAFEATANAQGGVEISFDKYMKPESLTAENLIVKGVKGDEKTTLVPDTIICPDLEIAIADSALSFAKKVFIATSDLSGYDEVEVTVKGEVESYAGLAMHEVYQQALDIERRLVSIDVDSLTNVGFQGNTIMHLAVLPVESAAGRQVTVTTADVTTATLGAEGLERITLTLDENGKADFQLNGSLFGKTVLRYSVVDDDLQSRSIVSVVDPAYLEPVQNVTASRMSGTAVYNGQTVTLSCATQGATIYYTTDGTCPCESATRKLYTAPLMITQATNLKVMAIGYTGAESDITEYNYTIRQADNAVALAQGWNWTSHTQSAPIVVEALQNVGSVVTATEAQTEIPAQQSFKVNTAAATVLRQAGDLHNPIINEIGLQPGLNWLGYPISEYLSLQDALTYLQPAEDDVIISLEDGFASYSAGQWVGTLNVMRPGQGYLYVAGESKTFAYNIQPTVDAQQLYTSSAKTDSDVNVHEYPDVMPLICIVPDEHDVITPDAFEVKAYCAGQCRGTGVYVGNLIMMNIHGTEGEEITITITEKSSGYMASWNDKKVIKQELWGTVQAPINFGEAYVDAIHGVAGTQTSNTLYNLQGQRVNKVKKGIFIQNGKKVLVK